MILRRQGSWHLLVAPGREALAEKLAALTAIPARCERVLRDDRHAFVGILALDGATIVAKSPRYKDRRPWLRWLSLVRQGYAFRIVRFLRRLEEEGLPSAAPVLAMEQRRRGRVVCSWIFYDYLPGEPCRPKDFPQVIALLGRLHARGWIHGDAHARNFIVHAGRVQLLDPAPRRKWFGRISEAYDYIRLRNSLPGEELAFPIPTEAWAFRVAAAHDRWIHTWRAIKRRLRGR